MGQTMEIVQRQGVTHQEMRLIIQNCILGTRRGMVFTNEMKDFVTIITHLYEAGVGMNGPVIFQVVTEFDLTQLSAPGDKPTLH